MTQPSAAMRAAMAGAPVGDDGFGEDPTVRHLEEVAAQILGKESALFVPSGTMGNLIAVSVLTRPGDEVILEGRGYSAVCEQGGMAAVAGVMPRPIWAEDGHLTADRIESELTSGDDSRRHTGLIILENTHAMAGGTIYRPEVTEGVISLARARSVPVHLDGARLFNAAIALGVDVEELAVGFDSVMLCLAKGLGAPAGALLMGNRAVVERSRRVRGMLGGGMRQVGVLAAAGLVALEHGPEALVADHRRARALADGLQSIEGLEIDAKGVATNIVIFSLADARLSAVDLVERLRGHDVLVAALDPFRVRMVTHSDIDDAAITRTLEVVEKLLR